MTRPTRAHLSASAGLATIPLCVLLTGLAIALAHSPAAAEPIRHHALSLVDKPRFPADFKHFDWVNPDAPKGGVLRQADIGTFDSLNGYSIQGNAAEGLGLIDDSLMISSPDEPSTQYCLICEWVSYPDDFSSVTFKLRDAARFHDGKPIVPDDVIFSMETLKAAHPQFALYYKNVAKAEKTGEREVTFSFDSKGNRELPMIVGELPILPKHYWTAKSANGEPRDIKKSSLEVPLGSGPYKIKSFEPARQITYERVKDYWAKDLPAIRGQFNYDEVNYVYFRDAVPAFEAFKSGQLDVWPETSANRWNTQYGFDAVTKGAVKKEALPHKRVAPMQAFAFNLRRKQFQDPRVRKAFALAFNFEEANKSLFYGQYVRVASYFDNSELKSSGIPQGQELEILKTVEKDVPPEIFTTEWNNPVNNAPTDFRKNMSEAAKLLAAAGWTQKGGQLVNAAGEPLVAEFLLVQPDFERIVLPYVKELEKLGVKAAIRIVDTSQYKRRIDTFDFDLVVHSVAQSHSPGNEQRNYWGSASADREGSRNVMGIKNPAIDALIDRIVFAKDRAELVAATRALDRVLLWNHYLVPQWHYPFERLAVWDKFGRPEKLPSQSASLARVWWIDDAKVKALAAQKSQ